MTEHNLPVPDDAPWLNLSKEELQELKNKKFELTEYAKKRLREMMTHEEMLEEAERREVANRELEKEEWERKQRSDTILRRYNHFYNEEVSGLPHGTPVTMEQLQAITLDCAVDALMCENLNVEYNVIAIDDIKDLISRLYQQGNEYLERVRKLKGEE
jgi:hypothetical protein